MPEPTDEQISILDFVRASDQNLQIKALAGTGKTTTLEMIEQTVAGTPLLCLAFNKRIAEEMKSRFSDTSECRTLNSLGHRVWMKACTSRLVLEPKKTQIIFKACIEDWSKDDAKEAWEEYSSIRQSVDLAKSLGYVPEGKWPQAKRLISRDDFHAALDEAPSGLAGRLIDDILHVSIAQAYKGIIDFNDQVYMPALFGGTFPRFPVVLVDEAQDLSPTNHAMLDKLGKGRVIVVGDPWQSIYGFRGAVQSGMRVLAGRFAMSEADLSISFRCPQAVVESVHWHVPHFKWVKPGGKVYECLNPTADFIQPDSAIICRNNAPLFALGFRLIGAGRGVTVVGSDIGPRLLALMKKLGPPDLPRAAVMDKIDEWLAEKLAKESKTAHEMADCMRVFAQQGQTLNQAISYAEYLFRQTGNITLLTGHKAKGLEWNTVYHLDEWLLGGGEQEDNLRYVISTRAKEELYLIHSRDFTW
jgi:superfamily I DNA/RNA helicase